MHTVTCERHVSFLLKVVAEFLDLVAVAGGGLNQVGCLLRGGGRLGKDTQGARKTTILEDG